MDRFLHTSFKPPTIVGSTSKISALAISMECPGSVVCMCLETSEIEVLGDLCSMNRALNDRSVSPT